MEKDEKKLEKQDIDNKKVDNKKNEKTETKKDDAKFSQVKPKEMKKQKNDTKQFEDTKKKSKAGYWVGGIILVIVLLLAVTALIVLPDTPDKSVEGVLNCLKNGDFAGINKYTETEDISINEEDFSQEVMIELFNKMDWKVLKVNKDNDTATVELEVTNKDFKTIMGNYMQIVVKDALAGTETSESETQNKFLEELRKEDVSTVTNTVTIETVKKDGKWKVKFDENVMMSLLPGLEDSMNSLNSLDSIEG